MGITSVPPHHTSGCSVLATNFLSVQYDCSSKCLKSKSSRTLRSILVLFMSEAFAAAAFFCLNSGKKHKLKWVTSWQRNYKAIFGLSACCCYRICIWTQRWSPIILPLECKMRNLVPHSPSEYHNSVKYSFKQEIPICVFRVEMLIHLFQRFT